jgi:protein-S-isoprenylcysteine O-methyltransferase Ste14
MAALLAGDDAEREPVSPGPLHRQHRLVRQSEKTGENVLKRYARLAARLRVPSGFLIAAVYAIFSRPTPGSLRGGLLLGAAGLLLRGWASGHLEKNEALATSGPFARTRNPLYLGSFTAGAGFAIAGRNLWLAVLLLLYCIAVYLPAIAEEESHLRRIFPGYASYAARVPRLLPRFSAGTESRNRFRWSLYLRNREYQAAAAYAAVSLVLIWKILR